MFRLFVNSARILPPLLLALSLGAVHAGRIDTGFHLGSGFITYGGLGNSQLNFLNLEYGLATRLELDSLPRWIFVPAAYKVHHAGIFRADKQNSEICNSTFAENFWKLPGRCGALALRLDAVHDFDGLLFGGNITWLSDGGLTYQNYPLVNSHFKQVSVGAALGIITGSAERNLILLRVERTVWFRHAMPDVQATGWNFSLALSAFPWGWDL